MAPEIMSESPDYSVKVDMWSLGVMWHQMLFGDFPYEFENIFQTKRQLARFKYKANKYKYTGHTISPETEAMIGKLL